MKVREKKMIKKLGQCLVPFTRKTSWLIILVFVFAFAMVVIQYFRTFQLYINVILNAVAVLAVELSIRDRVSQKNSGLYTDALVVDGKIIEKKDIIALPTLEYEESEEYKKEKEADEYSKDAYETAMKSLKIVSDSHGEFYVGFASKEERAKAVEIIRKWI
nr:hypothetical protein [Treponemataceae bacterium]